MRFLTGAAACLVLVGCGAITPPPDTARIYPGNFGLFDNDVGAINDAQWAWASPSRVRGNPVDGARAVAAVDYLAGELTTSPRWDHMSPLTKLEMLQARVAVRQAMGIAPAARSQDVVDSLLRTAAALENHDQAAAMAALRTPVYTQPPEQTYAKLAALPFVHIANIATQHAAQQEFPEDSGGGQFF